jgi:NAD(P)-dependent dehydrogenase (short-subunit alcohol dehydrogenase family)
MKIVVITGSTRGIGYGLAEGFLKQGCSVVVCGRSQLTVDKAINDLAEKYSPERVFGQPCDVSAAGQLQELWDSTKANYGRVDIWINNAGIAHPMTSSWELPADRIASVIATNITGAIEGSSVALRGMMAQKFGAIYNMYGMGSNGHGRMRGLSIYGTTKAGVHYFTEALIQETRGTGVLVGAILPGMVNTEMVTDQQKNSPVDWEKDGSAMEIFADGVDVVAPWLALKVLENQQHGAHIRWISRKNFMKRWVQTIFHR